ncbi:MAG: hypothetical protein R3C59_28745 [Planctomycetaceae bacterium]
MSTTLTLPIDRDVPPSNTPTVFVRLLLIPVVLAAAFLRTQELSTVGVSFDESFCQKMVEFSWREMFHRMSLDVHPPLFYIILKAWGNIWGHGVVAGRALSAMLGVLSVVGTYAFVRKAYLSPSTPGTRICGLAFSPQL